MNVNTHHGRVRFNGSHIPWPVVIICDCKDIGEREAKTPDINITHLVAAFPSLLV
jgi:hypothetical protein